MAFPNKIKHVKHVEFMLLVWWRKLGYKKNKILHSQARVDTMTYHLGFCVTG